MIFLLTAVYALDMRGEINDVNTAMNILKNMKDTVSINLTDSNFEHQTQASTGATTGDWFVYFYDPNCEGCQLFTGSWKMLAKKVNKDPDLQINIARINSMQNPDTTIRFGVHIFPSFLYFSKGKVYNVTAKKDQYFLYDLLKNGEWKNYENWPVPPPKSSIDQFKSMLSKVPWPVYVGVVVAILVPAIFMMRKTEKTNRPDSPRKRE